VVFAYPEKLALLNSITHPAVRERSRALIEAAAEADPRAVVVYDVPLLVEAAVDHPFDIVVVVSATEENRLRRLTEIRGMSRVEALRRMASQAPESERLAIADVVIDANGSLEETRGQVDAFWSTIPRAG
jgi:dephospho-CoA kinase